jgi:sarcosine oxidase subunit alpha
VLEPSDDVPVPMAGFVTSSYASATLGRTFALALLEGGRERLGTTVHVPLPDRIVPGHRRRSRSSRPEGQRRDG